MYSIKAHAKVNIYLKITGHRDGYHTLQSRFMRVENLYDTIEFVPCECNNFSIDGCEDIELESNTIFKAYEALNSYIDNTKVIDFFKNHKVVVDKQIPQQAGLGGGSSDGAAFMRLVNEVCELNISTDDLATLSSKIGADLPFFIYNYSSANVSGFGEMVEKFEEEPLELELYTPKDVVCDTTEVYKTFKKYLLQHISLTSFFGWNRLDSQTILSLIVDPIALNDLYPAAMVAYPKLEELKKDGWFFSGSGSTFFRVKPSS